MLKAHEYQRRRKNLMASIGKNAIAIFAAAPEHIRNNDVHHRYRQDSDFWYLTGFNEPEAVAVLLPERPQGEFILFCRERNPDKEQWEGARAGTEGAIADYHADDAFPIDDIDEILPALMENRARIYYTLGRHLDFDKQIIHWLQQVRAQSLRGATTPSEFIDLDFLVHEQRLFKNSAEVKLMQKAAYISAQAHIRAMQQCRAGMFEYQLEAEILYDLNRHGMDTAYPSIVGGGANGCVLHYTANNQALKEGDLVLIDAGGEYQGYAADITRTFPVSGRFSPAQREVYEVVLAAQQAAIDATVAGNDWNTPHQNCVLELVRGLKDLGLLSGSLAQILKKQSYRRFYMHRTGHWLGMDVHDVGDYQIDGKWRELEAGMVTTVEPGLYINADKDIPKRFRNIGIRIEDDVLINQTGNTVLSSHAPKDIASIEQLVGSGA